jgi:hypothetical protein
MHSTRLKVNLGLLPIVTLALVSACSDRVVASAVATDSSTSAAYYADIEYADCLWYTARNHGFYTLQSNVASGSSNEENTRFWMQFVESTGKEECGPFDQGWRLLKQALSRTAKDADRYFMATR